MDDIDPGPPRPALRDAVEARYGRADPAAGALPDDPALWPGLWNGTIATLLAHRSVRRYAARPLPRGLLELLAAAAQSAPSSSNLQACSIVAVEDPARRERLAALAGGQRHVAEAPLLLLFVADLARLRAVARRLGDAADGLDYTECFVIALTDAAFAAQNALVALESLGLGACYIGAMRNHPEAVAAELRLPDETVVVFGLTVGYPDPAVETGVKPRLPQSVVLHRETYAEAPAAPFAAYDAAMRDFRHDQAMSDTDWTRQATRRVRSADALSGRHVLRDVLRRRGFGLR